MIYKIVHNALTGSYYVYRTDHPIQVVMNKTPAMNRFICSGDSVRKNRGLFIEYIRKEKEEE